MEALRAHAAKKESEMILRQPTPLVGFMVDIQQAIPAEMATGNVAAKVSLVFCQPWQRILGCREKFIPSAFPSER